MIDGLAPLDKGIADALHDFREFENTRAAAIKVAQASCPHLQVLCAPPVGCVKTPLRMCACCRVEEVGAPRANRAHWSTENGQMGELGNAAFRVVLEADRQDIYALRLPGPRHLTSNALKERVVA